MKGYWVDVTLEGLNLERFLSSAGAAGVTFRRVKRKASRRLCLLVREGALPAIEELAARGGWSLRIGRRHGAGRAADWVRGHVCLCLILIAVSIAAFFATQVMWRIRLVDAGTYAADMTQYLTELGIRPVMWKREIDLPLLRDRLEWRYPEVARVDCGWRGMTLRICMTAGEPGGDPLSTNGQQDIVASRPGIVDSVVTYAGTPLVKKGQLVREGQVLIRGEERSGQDQTVPVRAAGTVMARVWDSARVRFSAVERITAYTGQTYVTTAVACPWFDLWPTMPSPFEQEDVSVTKQPLCSLFIPLTLRREVHREAVVTVRPRDAEQLKAEAGLAALRALRSKIGFGDKLVDKYIEYSMIEDEVLYADAIGERIVDIAQPAP